MSQKSEVVNRFDFSHPGIWIPAYLDLNWRKARYKLLYGSRGRGATTNVVQVIAAKMLAGHMKGVMVRKVFDDIRGSQWDSIKQWTEENRIDHHFVFQKAPLEVICKSTESRLISRGMDNPNRAKSIPGLSLAWFEEADEITAEDFRQTDLSIRGDNIEQWLTFNSPPVDHWLLPRFFPGRFDDKGRFTPDLSFEREDGMFTWVKSTDPDALIMHACYKHNPFNKPSFIKAQERDRETAPESYRTAGLGLMGRLRTGMEFFPDFKESKHVEPVDYDPDKALHITLDFNSAPYMTLLVAQIHQMPMGKWRVAFLKEYTPAHPLSSTTAVCRMFREDLLNGCFKGHDAGLMYYGDASGKASTTMGTDTARHNFEVVENELRRWIDGRSDMVLKRNPPHIKARDFMAHCLTGRLPIEVSLHPDMHTTISDIVHLKQGAGGDILKEYETDPMTKVRYEKWGHCAQAMYYLVIAAFKDVYDEMESMAG